VATSPEISLTCEAFGVQTVWPAPAAGGGAAPVEGEGA